MEENSQPRRRWFRFSLRSMLLLTMVVAVVAYGYQIFQRKRYCEVRAAAHKQMFDDYKRMPDWYILWDKQLNSAQISRLEFHQYWYDYYQQATQRPWVPLIAESEWPDKGLPELEWQSFEEISPSQLNVYPGYTP